MNEDDREWCDADGVRKQLFGEADLAEGLVLLQLLLLLVTLIVLMVLLVLVVPKVDSMREGSGGAFGLV